MSSDRGSVARLLDLVAAGLAALKHELATEDHTLALLAQVGVAVSTVPSCVVALRSKSEAVDANRAALNTVSGTAAELSAVLTLSASLVDLVTALFRLGDEIVAEIGASSEQPSRTDIGLRLLDRLMVDEVTRQLPVLGAGLRTLGIFESGDEPTPPPLVAPMTSEYPANLDRWIMLEPPEDPNDYVRPTPDWDEPGPDVVVHKARRIRVDRVQALLSDTGALANEALGWGTTSFRGLDVLTRIEAFARATGFSVSLGGRPAATASDQQQEPVLNILLHRSAAEIGAKQLGLELFPLAALRSEKTDAGIAASAYAEGAPDLVFRISPSSELTLSGDMDISGNAQIEFRPGVNPRLGPNPRGVATPKLSGTLSATWRYAPSGRIVLLSQPNLLTISAAALRASVSFLATQDGLQPVVSVVIEDGAIDLGVSTGDSFLRAVIPTVAASFEFGLEWVSGAGFHLIGGIGLEIEIPLGLPLSLIEIDRLRFAIVPVREEGLELTVSADLIVMIGPIVATIERLGAGLTTRLAPDGGNLGRVHIEPLYLIPPTGLGLSVDLEGIITGGGYLSIDDGRYAGVAALQMFGVGLTVIGIIETELPDDPNGWSMFLSVIADFTPVPLGFGFFLSGVGGFMGLHRTLDEIALVKGVRDGRIDSLLFPEDPLADALRIISDIEAYFPTHQGTHAFGAMARIDWGVPTLISGELGVVLVVPDFRIAVIGEIESILPTPDAPLIELHMGVVGYIDPVEATFWVTASIYDSRLVQYALSGDMAMYAAFGEQPYFLLSVGGFHPDWKLPPCLPVTMRGLRRMTAAIDLGTDLQVGLEAYFAVTPNTLQFGAEVFAIAEMKKLSVDFTAKGDFGFDVLMIFTPFSITADMAAHVMIEAEGAPLVSARVSVHLEGPEPWFGRATATFEFMHQPVDFNVAFGGEIKNDAPDAIELWNLLEAALRLPASWSTPAIAASVTAEITHRPLDALIETGLWLAPDGALELRQRVLPLNQSIEVFGAYVPDGVSRFNVKAVGLSTGIETDLKLIEDWFAPAQFVAMGPNERLSAPSFEEMDAGVSFSAAGFAAPQTQADLAAVDLEYEELVLEDDTRQLRVSTLPLERFGLGPRFPIFALGAPAARRTVTNVIPFHISATRYDVADAFDASRIRRGGIYADAVIARRGTSSTVKTRARIVPTSAIQEHAS